MYRSLVAGFHSSPPVVSDDAWNKDPPECVGHVAQRGDEFSLDFEELLLHSAPVGRHQFVVDGASDHIAAKAHDNARIVRTDHVIFRQRDCLLDERPHPSACNVSSKFICSSCLGPADDFAPVPV